MLLKFTLVIGVLLLAKEASAINCYSCLGGDSDQCEQVQLETPCPSGNDYCFKFVGMAEDASLGLKGKVVAKSCSPADFCDKFKNNPAIKIDHCSVCKDKDYCNSSNIIQGKPLLMVLILTIVYTTLS